VVGSGGGGGLHEGWGLPGPDAPSNLPHLQVIFEASPVSQGANCQKKLGKSMGKFTGPPTYSLPIEIRP